MTVSTGGIYLDHHATTPVDPRVAEAVMRHMVQEFGNANSVDHVHGERAAAAIEAATVAVADLLTADPADVHFTSGSTHAIELAFSHALGTAKGSPLRVALSRVEHPAVMDMARRAEELGLATLRWINVAPDASIDMNQVEELLPGIDLLCLMVANNEVGTIYPVAEAYERAAAAGVAMLVDSTQAVGRVPLDLSATKSMPPRASGHWSRRSIAPRRTSVWPAAMQPPRTSQASSDWGLPVG
jgi:cysteine desulfurase